MAKKTVDNLKTFTKKHLKILKLTLVQHKSTLLKSLLVLVLIALSFPIFNLTLRVNYLLGNDLIIIIDPQETSIDAHYGDAVPIQFDVSSNNLPFCQAHCTYTFRDKSRSRIFDQGNFTITPDINKNFQYTLSSSRVGAGQDLYSFGVQCKNVKSFFCPTNSDLKFTSSFVTLNYDLSTEEKEVKHKLRITLNRTFSQFAEINSLLQQTNAKIEEVQGSLPTHTLLSAQISLDASYGELNTVLEHFRLLWQLENYTHLDVLFTKDIELKITDLKEQVLAHNNAIESIIVTHNTAIEELVSQKKSLVGVEEFFTAINATSKKSVNNRRSDFNTLIQTIATKNFTSHTELFKVINKSKRNIQELQQNIRAESQKHFLLSKLTLLREQDYFCVRNVTTCDLQNTIPSIVSDLEEVEDVFQTTITSETCQELENLSEQYALWKIGITTETNFTKQLWKNCTEFISSVYYESAQNARLTEPSKAPLFDTVITSSTFSSNATCALNASIKKQLQHLASVDKKSEDYLFKHCAATGIAPLLSTPSLVRVDLSTKNFSPTFSTELPDNKPVCCIFSDCQTCCTSNECRNDPSTFPIIFIHGHAASQSISASYSLEAFNDLQYRLESQGFINAGIVKASASNDPDQKGIWGLSGKPITVKASYYFDSIPDESRYIVVPTKSENIDTYALRLQEIIETVKQRTGKDKVNVVAHSMGGLVTRKYMQIFGDASVHKVIMIGTPNKGISGKVKDLCPFFGETKECIDMQEGSNFLKKLNDPARQPSQALLYTIAGVGCQTDGADGDGVVKESNVQLEGVSHVTIKGSCKGLLDHTLHSELLNGESYPETISEVTKMLSQ